LGDKVDSETKSKVEEASAALKKAMEGEDVEEIKKLSEELTQVSHKLAEAMYQQASTEQQAPGADADQADPAGGAAPEEDVVDADFEEVKEEDKK
jgi:molecular chaperone DnaK